MLSQLEAKIRNLVNSSLQDRADSIETRRGKAAFKKKPNAFAKSQKIEEQSAESQLKNSSEDRVRELGSSTQKLKFGDDAIDNQTTSKTDSNQQHMSGNRKALQYRESSEHLNLMSGNQLMESELLGSLVQPHNQFDTNLRKGFSSSKNPEAAENKLGAKRFQTNKTSLNRLGGGLLVDNFKVDL